MSSDIPGFRSTSVEEAALAEQFRKEAERERRLARRYRRLGWVAASIAVSSVPCSVIVISGSLVKQDSALAFGVVLLLLAILTPVVALMLFGTASRHSRRAARCKEAAGPVVGATDMLADAESSRRAARRLRWLWPVVIVWGLLATVTLLFRRLGLFVIVEPANWLSLRIATLRRRADLLAECVRLGFSYRETPLKALLAPFDRLPLFCRGGKATHLMEGYLAGRAVRIMDYAIPLDEDSEKRQTVVIVGLNSSRAVFRLWPTSPVAASAPSHVVVALKQTAPSDNEFVPNDLPAMNFTADGLERRYLLFGRREDREYLEAILTGDVADFLNKHPGLALEVEDGLLAVYQPGVVWEPRDYSGRLDHVLTLCARLEAAFARQDRTW